jgi:hypothetical protein
LVPFNVFVLLIFYNYYLAVTTDPGKVPPQWVSRLDTGKDSLLCWVPNGGEWMNRDAYTD